jgi:hypothetical protein
MLASTGGGQAFVPQCPAPVFHFPHTTYHLPRTTSLASCQEQKRLDRAIALESQEQECRGGRDPARRDAGGHVMKMIEAVKTPQPRHAKTLSEPQAASACRRHHKEAVKKQTISSRTAGPWRKDSQRTTALFSLRLLRLCPASRDEMLLLVQGLFHSFKPMSASPAGKLGVIRRAYRALLQQRAVNVEQTVRQALGRDR